MSLKRQVERNKKKAAEKELKQKVSMFDKMPDCCVSCFKDFDKRDREMVMTWFVVERRKEKKVNLYCPECWEDGINMVKHMITKKETEADRHIRENQDKDLLKKKIAPDPCDMPAVDDYVVDKHLIPKEEK
jgi:hypothetical protein